MLWEKSGVVRLEVLYGGVMRGAVRLEVLCEGVIRLKVLCGDVMGFGFKSVTR